VQHFVVGVLSDAHSRISNVVLNQPPTNDILVCEVLYPALHVLTSDRKQTTPLSVFDREKEKKRIQTSLRE
jgi:hypothetical protein